jgi:hypothetical protein
LLNVLTKPLTDAVSVLTSLTSLTTISLYSPAYYDDDEHDDQEKMPLLPAAAAVLTGLQQLDINALTLPPALEALAGMHLTSQLGAHMRPFSMT